jgi:hypothetical protein
VLIWRSQGDLFWLPCRPTRRFSFNLAYDRLVFNGLLFIWGTLKKWTCPLQLPVLLPAKPGNGKPAICLGLGFLEPQNFPFEVSNSAPRAELAVFSD